MNRSVIRCLIAIFPFNLHITVQTSTGGTLAMLMFQRELPLALGMLLPYLDLTMHRAMPGIDVRPFEVGQKASVRLFHGKLEWLPGVITESVGQRSWNIQVKHRLIGRHIERMLQREAHDVNARGATEITTPPAVLDTPAEKCTPVVAVEPVVASRAQVVCQRQHRARRPPQRYTDFI